MTSFEKWTVIFCLCIFIVRLPKNNQPLGMPQGQVNDITVSVSAHAQHLSIFPVVCARRHWPSILFRVFRLFEDILMINATHHHMKYSSAWLLSRLPCHNYNTSTSIASVYIEVADLSPRHPMRERFSSEYLLISVVTWNIFLLSPANRWPAKERRGERLGGFGSRDSRHVPIHRRSEEVSSP